MKGAEIEMFFRHLMTLSFPKISISEEFIKWITLNQQVVELAAVEICEMEIDRVKRRIEADIKFHNSRYTFPRFQFEIYDDDVLIQTHLIHGKEKREEVACRINWWQELHALIKSLSWRDFEKLARLILKENGLDDIVITSARNDQGIDFYGHYTFRGSGLVKRLQKDLKFRVVGQVKHSALDNGVSYQKVASFGTEISKLRKLNASHYFQDLNEEFILSPYPIQGIFIANSFYPPKSRDFAKEYGIMIWEGVQIAQDLSSPEFVRKLKNEEGQLSLSKLQEYIS